jgi:PAS domain S-box-containing protein
MPPTKPLLHDYRVALATPMLAFVFALLLPSSGQLLHLPLFMVAVLVSASYGGLYSGALATTLSGVFLGFHHVLLLWLRPATADRDFFLWLGAFVFLGLLASYLSRLCRRSIEEAVRLHTALSALRTALIFTDNQGRITFANPVARRLTGWQGSEAAVESADNVLRTDEERPVDRVLRSADGSGLVRATRLLPRNGAERQIEFWADPLQDPRGGTCGASLLFREAGERWRAEQELRQREERYRALTASAPGPVLLLDPAGQCVYSNAACQALLGCSGVEALGDGWVRAVHADDQAVANEWVAAAREGKPFDAELRFQNAPGGSRWVQLRSTTVPSDQGKCLGHVGTFEDVTRRKELEREVMERQRAEEALRNRHEELQGQARERIAELEQANAVLREQLAERGRVENELRQEQERSRQHAQRQEQELRQRLADAEKAGSVLRDQLGERARAEDELRRRQEEAQNREDEMRRRLAESEEAATGLRERASEMEKATAGLREQLDERQKAEGVLRQEHDHARQQGQQQQEDLRRRLAEVEAAGNLLQQELAELRRRDEEMCRQHEQALSQAGQREDDLRRQSEQALAQAAQREEELRSREQFFGSLLENLDAGVVAWDEQGQVALLNQIGQANLALPERTLPFEAWLEHHCLCGSNGSALSEAANPFLRAPNGQWVHRTEMRIQRKEGEARVFSASGGPFHDAEGRRRGAVLLLLDVTEHQRTADQLREQLNTVCRQSEEERKQRQQKPTAPEDALFPQNILLERLSRVLRRPLLPLAQALQTFQGAETDRTLNAATHAVERELRALTLIAESLETMAALAGGRLSLDRQPVELEALLKRAVEAVQPFLEGRGQRLTLSLPLTPEWILADPVRLEHILVQLLHNALRHSETGGHIRLSAERGVHETVFRVQDEGCGIRAEDLPDLFDLYRPAEGLGFGLPLVRGVTELHGGQVSVASGGPGLGSEFTVALPAPPRKMLTRTAEAWLENSK